MLGKSSPANQATLRNCGVCLFNYFTDSTLYNSVYGGSDSNPTITSTPESASPIDSSFAENHEQSSTKATAGASGSSKRNENMITFKVNDYNGFTLSLQLILLTDITGTEREITF